MNELQYSRAYLEVNTHLDCKPVAAIWEKNIAVFALHISCIVLITDDESFDSESTKDV